MEIEIREIREPDYPEVVLLWNNELGSRTLTDDNVFERFDRLRANENYKTFVALFNQRVVGCITMVEPWHWNTK